MDKWDQADYGVDVPWDPSLPHGTNVTSGTGLTLECGVWDVPWDPSLPHGTDGMGWTSGTGLAQECGVWDAP